MTRIDLLEAASMKLAEAVLLLTKAGEQHLAISAGELAEIVEFRAGAASSPGNCESVVRHSGPAPESCARAFQRRT